MNLFFFSHKTIPCQLRFKLVSPCPQGPPTVDVWQVHCACPSEHTILGWWCFCAPGSPHPLSVVFQHHAGSFCHGTRPGPPAPLVPGRLVSARGEGSSCPQTLPCTDPTPESGLAPGPVDETEWHPQRALGRESRAKTIRREKVSIR